MAKERKYLTAIAICSGIISLIDEEGQIRYYRQRGIQKFNNKQRSVLIAAGLLRRDWEMYKELPSNISISFEDPEIMGRAQASYPSIDKINKMLQCNVNHR